MSYFRARGACKQLGMQLYKRNSSPESAATLSQFAVKVLKGNPKAEVFIAGTRPGFKCLTLNGDKTISYVSCPQNYHFICEFIQKRKDYPYKYFINNASE